MALKETALSILIKAKDLASAPLAKFRRGVSAADEDVAQLGKASNKSSKKVDKLGDSIDKTGTLAGKAKTGMSVLTGSIVALGGTYLSINALKNAISGIINTGAKFEQLKVQMTTLMGSIAAGAKAAEWVKAFAQKTPAQLEGVMQGFIKLKAFGIDPMGGSYQAIVDQTSKLGFTQEKMEGIILAVGQAWTKQKLQGEEALQLIERGVPVWDLLSKATGKSTVELQKMASAGQLGREEIQLLIDEMGKASAGAAEAQMATWSGMVSNLKDRWALFVADIAEAGVFDVVKQQLSDLLEKATELAKDGTLKKWAQEISDKMSGLVLKTREAVETLSGHFDSLKKAAELSSATMRIVFNVFSAGISTIVAAVAHNFKVLMKTISTAAEYAGLEQVKEKFAKAAAGLSNISSKAAKQATQDSKDIREAWAKLSGQSFEGAKTQLKTVSATSRQAAAEISTEFTKVGNDAESTGEQIRNAFVSAINTAKSKEEINELTQQFGTLASEGRVSALQLTQGLSRIELALQNIKKAGEQAKSSLPGKDGISVMNDGMKTYFENARKARKATEDKANATKKAAQADKEAAAAEAELTEQTQKNTEAEEKNQARKKHGLPLAGKSAAAWKRAGSAMGQTYRRLGQYMIDAVQGAKGTLTYLSALGRASRYVRVEAERLWKTHEMQKQSAEQHLQTLQTSEHVTAQMVNTAEIAANRYNLLGREQLAPLRNAIAQIRADMEAMSDEAEQTRENLQDEVDRLSGNDEAIARRAYERKLEELRAKLEAAQRQSNQSAIADLREAIELLKQAERIRKDQAKEERSSTTNNRASDTYRLEIPTDFGSPAASFNSAMERDEFLKALGTQRAVSSL